MCISGRMSQGLGLWIHRSRHISIWFHELTVNPVDFILPGSCNRAVPIGRACIISFLLSLTINTKCVNIATELTLDHFFWPQDDKVSRDLLENYLMRKARFATKGSYSNVPFSIFDVPKTFTIGSCTNIVHFSKIYESCLHSSI